ncbi:hypothetical protein [Caproiciproducens galactitolivorans]|uniref:hypothetical protein n=1 Tax=Caproiciproducens galactitolivorans TaxID=642589 RepID=UPI0024098DB9|nr:hypothetical protein [Caproiciproducens galactitolivorans]
MRKKLLLFTGLAVLLAAVFAVGCSQQNGNSGSQGDGFKKFGAQSGREEKDTSQIRIYGKVKSVTGNQVVLSIGTSNKSGRFGSGSTQGQQESSSSSAQEASSAKSSASGSDSSDITLTGETQTFLIPVGLTLSNAGQDGSNASGSSRSAPNVGAMGAGGNAAASKDAGCSSSGMGTVSTRRASDFSSIKVGMVLVITEQTQSDGTKQITRVSVLSK